STLLLFKDPATTATYTLSLHDALPISTELGAGFHIALKDLEIRGAGNLLGPEQSGHVSAVGFDLYTRLLATAVEKARSERRALSVTGGRSDGGPTDRPSSIVHRPPPAEPPDEEPTVSMDLPI